MSIEERFNTAVNVIKGLPKNGKTNYLSILKVDSKKE